MREKTSVMMMSFVHKFLTLFRSFYYNPWRCRNWVSDGSWESVDEMPEIGYRTFLENTPREGNVEFQFLSLKVCFSVYYILLVSILHSAASFQHRFFFFLTWFFSAVLQKFSRENWISNRYELLAKMEESLCSYISNSCN